MADSHSRFRENTNLYNTLFQENKDLLICQFETLKEELEKISSTKLTEMANLFIEIMANFTYVVSDDVCKDIFISMGSKIFEVGKILKSEETMFHFLAVFRHFLYKTKDTQGKKDIFELINGSYLDWLDLCTSSTSFNMLMLVFSNSALIPGKRSVMFNLVFEKIMEKVPSFPISSVPDVLSVLLVFSQRIQFRETIFTSSKDYLVKWYSDLTLNGDVDGNYVARWLELVRHFAAARISMDTLIPLCDEYVRSARFSRPKYKETCEKYLAFTHRVTKDEVMNESVSEFITLPQLFHLEKDLNELTKEYEKE
ncbi:hypothetical protein ADUPG1_006025, partial [Aduncisulcus paluster]